MCFNFAAVGNEAKDFVALHYERRVPLRVCSINELRSEIETLKSTRPKPKIGQLVSAIEPMNLVAAAPSVAPCLSVYVIKFTPQQL